MRTQKHISSAIFTQLLRIGGRLQKIGDRLASEYDLNQPQFVVLHEVANKKKLIQKDIIENLVLNKSHVSKMTQKLNRLGYISIMRTSEDKRRTVLNVTDKGYIVWKNCLNKFKKWNKEWLRTLTNEQLDQLHQNINKISKLL